MFKNVYFDLFERERHRQTYTDQMREFPSLVHSATVRTVSWQSQDLLRPGLPHEWQGSRFELSSSACLSIPLHPAPQYISRKLDRKHGSWELNKNCDVGFGYPKKWLNKNLSLHFHLFIHCVWEANRRKLEINHGPALFSKMFATALQEAETGNRARTQQNTHIYMGVSVSILNAIPKWFPKLLWVWWVGIAS